MSSNLIIHPTDFSKCSNTALEYAINLAQLFKYRILLVHSIDPGQLEDYSQSGQMLLEKSKELEDAIENKLKKIGAEVQRKGIECSAQIYGGKLSSWLPDMIRQHCPEFVVMGTTGAGSVANKLFGSNAYSILQTSSSPVLAIPKGLDYTSPKKTLFAADLKTITPELIKYVYGLTSSFEGQLSVAYATKEDQKDVNAKVLEKFKTSFVSATEKGKLNFRLLENNDYVEAIIEHIKEVTPDLLVFVMSDKNFFERMFFDSLSNILVHHSKTPLLAIPRDMEVK